MCIRDSPQTLDLLERQGFVQAEAVSGYPLLIVDMRSPVTLMQNILTTLKEPFSSDGQVLTAVGAAGSPPDEMCIRDRPMEAERLSVCWESAPMNLCSGIAVF